MPSRQTTAPNVNNATQVQNLGNRPIDEDNTSAGNLS